MLEQVGIDAGVIVALIGALGVLVTQWVKRRADKDSARLEEKTRAQSHEIEAQKTSLDRYRAEMDAIQSTYIGFKEAVEALQITVSSQAQRIQILDDRQVKTENRLADTQQQLEGEQEARKKQAEMIRLLMLDREGLINYAKQLRAHIERRDPPPPEDWPRTHEKLNLPLA
ncbi:hypothetical protein [Actinotignum urinale]|uniref:DNA recombination protein RmuC n=1 Tax=Actinotignum urinale TaxID=190146 RepID=A0AAW9HTT6_9ACTO|nr:hypothetical protein [Actinotignum urinale]MDY5154274.1 hypothetical protein [Actinotignum urinale]